MIFHSMATWQLLRVVKGTDKGWMEGQKKRKNRGLNRTCGNNLKDEARSRISTRIS